MNQSPLNVKTEMEVLRDRMTQFSTLIETGAIISSTLDLDEVISLVMSKAQQVMGASACSILLYRADNNTLELDVTTGDDNETSRTLKKMVQLQMGEGVAGWAAEKRETVLVKDARKDDRHWQKADQATGFVTTSIIAVPMINKGELIGVAEVMNPVDKESFTEEDAELFETFCRQVAIAIDNARYHKSFINEQRMKQQLDIAKSIQKSFLPPLHAPRPDCPYTLSAATEPAFEVGGDLYDYMVLPGDRLAVMIGDVSGKGVGAALYMARVVSELRYVARLVSDPGEVMTILNQSLCRQASSGMFITAVYWVLDLERGEMAFCNCGHLPSMLRKADSKIEMIEESAGPPLGILPELNYESAHLKLDVGDRILLMTDGVVEAYRGAREEFGFDRVRDVLANCPPDAPAVEPVVKAIKEYVKGRVHDDLTLVEFGWTGPGRPSDRTWVNDPLVERESEAANETVEVDISLNPKMMRVVRDVAGRMAALSGLTKEESNGFKLAVDEACANVLRHAYGGDDSRRLTVKISIEPNGLRVVLHDSGRGFNPEDIPPLEEPRLEPGGLGLHLIRTVMDEVDYQSSEVEGNTLTMVKYTNKDGGRGES